MTTDVHTCYQNILTELKRLNESDVWNQTTSAFPGLIANGSGGSIVVNGAIEKEIRTIADWILNQRPAEKSQHTLKEWRARVRQAFGPALVQIDLDQSVSGSGRLLKRLVETAIGSTPQVIPSQFTSIGCRLFDEPLATSLKIGPVLFESKADWLLRAEMIGQITRKTRGRLTRAFAGHRLRKLKNLREDMFDRQFVNVLGKAQLVCTIETQYLAPELSQVRAITGARLGQAAISLLWVRPSTALEGFSLSVDHGWRRVNTIPYVPGYPMIGGSLNIGGPTIKPNDWDGLLSQARSLLDLAGRMIECWTNAKAFGTAPPILRSLAQGLCFFWEACRDENDLMAIVKFTAVLEALAPPGKADGIKKLCMARLGIKDGVKFVGDRNLDEVINWLYSKGRSRTLHGTNPEILHDWTELRAVAEVVTRHCLVQSMVWLEHHPAATKTEDLLT